jgi:putative phage-type endonuclease
MKIIDIQQKTPEWYEFRRRHIGASDSPIIMGDSPWTTRDELWSQKIFDVRKDMTDAMQRGIDLEPKAREFFIKETGIEVFPLVAEDDTHPFLSASFDGISLDGKTILEIKCPSTQEGVNRYPGIYTAQFQKQMYIANVSEMYYLAYFMIKEGNSEHTATQMIKIYRDQFYIDEMIKQEIQFWETIKDLL